MYPFLRIQMACGAARRAPPLAMTDTLVTRTTILPWDLDIWNELNNGRTLTLFDLGRLPLLIRTGVLAAARAQGWGLTVAGSSVRYRRRVTLFDRLEMRSRILGWDQRFFYIDQSLWRKDEATSHVLIRKAVAGKQGIVAPAEVLTAMGRPYTSPPLPGWVAAWIGADRERPWPPQT
ncbi:acyl-CoA thioesterase [Frigidibacter sp. MR17.14]|uniref:acyl-CoA thioesterase n=1 Tax=Frigidibacter sp. MR17.14 TaxID=3126509 RepID=UPI003013142D